MICGVIDGPNHLIITLTRHHWRHHPVKSTLWKSCMVCKDAEIGGAFSYLCIDLHLFQSVPLHALPWKKDTLCRFVRMSEASVASSVSTSLCNFLSSIETSIASILTGVRGCKKALPSVSRNALHRVRCHENPTINRKHCSFSGNQIPFGEIKVPPCSMPSNLPLLWTTRWSPLFARRLVKNKTIAL